MGTVCRLHEWLLSTIFASFFFFFVLVPSFAFCSQRNKRIQHTPLNRRLAWRVLRSQLWAHITFESIVILRSGVDFLLSIPFSDYTFCLFDGYHKMYASENRSNKDDTKAMQQAARHGKAEDNNKRVRHQTDKLHTALFLWFVRMILAKWFSPHTRCNRGGANVSINLQLLTGCAHTVNSVPAQKFTKSSSTYCIFFFTVSILC